MTPITKPPSQLPKSLPSTQPHLHLTPLGQLHLVQQLHRTPPLLGVAHGSHQHSVSIHLWRYKGYKGLSTVDEQLRRLNVVPQLRL